MALRGPIDYIIVGFVDNKFDGSILTALGDAIDKGIVGLVSLALITKDQDGSVALVDINEAGDTVIIDFGKKYKSDPSLVTSDDVSEVGELLENNTSAGMLVVEQLWAKPLKQAIINANGVLIADGRIHSDAAKELSEEN